MKTQEEKDELKTKIKAVLAEILESTNEPEEFEVDPISYHYSPCYRLRTSPRSITSGSWKKKPSLLKSRKPSTPTRRCSMKKSANLELRTTFSLSTTCMDRT